MSTPTASVDGTEHPAHDFAYVPDPSKPSTWKLPIFDAGHVRNALARFDQTELPEGARSEVRQRILAAAHRFGIDVGAPKSEAQDGVELKSLGGFEIKDEAKGEVSAVVATFGVVDKDKDIIRPDAIKDGAKVKVSGYGHGAIFGEAPVGKGTLHVQGDKMVFKGNYFMDTQSGREAFCLMKAMGADQEWSFGFRVLGSEIPDEKESKMGAYRILTKLNAFEVSPVIVGAGIGTQTLSAKEAGKAPTASVDGTEHPAHDFAYVPDSQKPSTWKLPIFDADHVRNALARFDQTELPDGARGEVRNRILEAAHRFGIDVSPKKSEPLFPMSVQRVINSRR